MSVRLLALVGLVVGALGGCDRKVASTPARDLGTHKREPYSDPVQQNASGAMRCVFYQKPPGEKCPEYARDFVDDLLRWGRRPPDVPTAFDCRTGLMAARRFVPERRAALVELCCPLKGADGRDDDGTALCDSPKVKP